ncbi:long-chain-fatty-acid--CoA ligase [Epidermidibacterium keratini]|uniref:Long-chain-fatty-acid--CoA ligase n=2 Tax=Epidermidibacterium keratini TaxID=1891644 RepID=A0A7L4YTC0_9ACTN|nr:long-chain-fatty-acid--CoA ligase [Epidermidibacterium keratini]
MSHGMQLARHARKIGDEIAIVYGDQRITYRELDQRVTRLARGLAERGVGRGDRVAVLMFNRIEVIESYFAIIRLGAIAVPINFRLTAAEAAYIIDDSGAQILITEAALLDTARGAITDAAGDPALVIADGQGADGGEAYESVLSDDDSELEIDVPEDDPAFIMYTSGTTGRPKGAVITHFNLLMNSHNCMIVQGIKDRGEVWLSGLPLFHIGGLNGILFYILAGGRIVLMKSGDFSADDAVSTFESEGITSCYFVPTQWKAICEVPGVTERAASLRRISWGASIAPPSTLQAMAEAFPGVPNFNMFGQTEMSSVTCVLRGEDAVRKMGSVGTAAPNVEVQIVRPDMTECGVGEVGEIVYRGPTVMREYWNKPKETDEAFRGGWFHSGDLCVMDDEGFITVVDRVKDMIISGGENIYCAEVEAAIDAHPKVREVAVVGRPDPKWVETPVAFVVPTDPNDPPTEDDVIAFVKDRIASYKKPSAVEIVDELPRNATGKVQKFKLRDT